MIGAVGRCEDAPDYAIVVSGEQVKLALSVIAFESSRAVAANAANNFGRPEPFASTRASPARRASAEVSVPMVNAKKI